MCFDARPVNAGIAPNSSIPEENPKTVAGCVGKHPNVAARVTTIVIWIRKVATAAAGALVEAAWVIGTSTRSAEIELAMPYPV